MSVAWWIYVTQNTCFAAACASYDFCCFFDNTYLLMHYTVQQRASKCCCSSVFFCLIFRRYLFNNIIKVRNLHSIWSNVTQITSFVSIPITFSVPEAKLKKFFSLWMDFCSAGDWRRRRCFFFCINFCFYQTCEASKYDNR